MSKLIIKSDNKVSNIIELNDDPKIERLFEQLKTSDLTTCLAITTKEGAIIIGVEILRNSILRIIK